MIRTVGDRTVVAGRGGGVTYLYPVSVDWQSPDCASQILMVLSQLPLAICFPSGFHATERTLKLRENVTRINRNSEKRIQRTYNSECPVGHWVLANVHFEIIDIYIIFGHIFIIKKLPFRVVILTGIQINKRIFFLLFSCRVHQKNANVRVSGQFWGKII